MTRIDLDDLPPRIAELLRTVSPGEEVVLVQGGQVVGRLVGRGAEVEAEPDPEPEEMGREKATEIFEQFRALIEDEF